MRFFGLFESRLEYDMKTVRYKNKTFRLEVADTLRKLSVGLMNRDKLAKNRGMLFVFGRDGRPGIWMLHMKISIDIIWLDRRGVVVHMWKSAKPCKNMFFCRTQRPKKDARYVIELRAGTANEVGLKLGDRFVL
jgi:hypothetical protein